MSAPKRTAQFADGFRPVLTAAGRASPLFSGLLDGQKAFSDDVPPLFWYCRGVAPKPGATVLAEHPADAGPGRPRPPLFVAGRFGKGRVLFSGVDDTWRWRFNTGEARFGAFWVELVHSLAPAVEGKDEKIQGIDKPPEPPRTRPAEPGAAPRSSAEPTGGTLPFRALWTGPRAC